MDFSKHAIGFTASISLEFYESTQLAKLKVRREPRSPGGSPLGEVGFLGQAAHASRSKAPNCALGAAAPMTRHVLDAPEADALVRVNPMAAAKLSHYGLRRGPALINRQVGAKSPEGELGTTTPAPGNVGVHKPVAR